MKYVTSRLCAIAAEVVTVSAVEAVIGLNPCQKTPLPAIASRYQGPKTLVEPSSKKILHAVATHWGGIGIEIAAAAGGGSTFPGYYGKGGWF